MQTVLLVIHLIIALALIAVVLLQRSEGGALGIGGGGGGSLFSARGVGNTLTRTTAVLAVIFFMTSIGLTLLAGRTGGSLFNHPATQGQTAPTGTGDSSLPSLPPAGQNQNQQGTGTGTGTGGTGQPQVPVSQ